MYKDMVAQNEKIFNVIERNVFKAVNNSGLQILKQILKQIDYKLLQDKPEGLECKDKVRRRILTKMGWLDINRRYYIEKSSGSKRYLLDEYMGLSKEENLSGGISGMLLEKACGESFREVAEEISGMLPSGSISHTTVMNYVRKAGERKARMEEIESAGEGGIRAPVLFTEADGIMVHLQREEGRRLLEIKAGIAHTGWEPRYLSSNERKLKSKMAYVSTGNGNEFWDGMEREIRRHYDIESSVFTILNSDGARWIKKGAECLPGQVEYQLDRYHINKEATKALGYDRKARMACLLEVRKGNLEGAWDILSKELREERCDKELVGKFYTYILNNREGLVDYRERGLKLPDGIGYEGMGAIEGSLAGTIGLRMKNNRTSWCRAGALSMGKLLQMKHTGKLESFLCENPWIAVKENITAAVEIMRTEVRKIRKTACKFNDINIDLPILTSGKDWVKVIRRLLECRLENIL